MLVKVIRSWLSVNQKEMKQFDRIQGWWHPSSPMHVLYQYNYQRVDFVKRVIESDKKKRNCFEVCKIIDVGCGAGFLATSLARLGADVIGLDPNSNSYRQATEHYQLIKQQLPNLHYCNLTIEDYLENHNNAKNSYDIVASMDVAEHVDNPQQFVHNLCGALSPGGYLVMSTISKTASTFVSHIVLAEYLTRIVPIGTHHYQKFILPETLASMMQKEGLQVIATRQLDFNWLGEFVETPGGGNYMMIGRKKVVSDSEKVDQQ